jgi:hypothetical protein
MASPSLSHGKFRGAYLALGYPNPGKIGSKGWVTLIPAAYVLNSTGLVVLSYLDADYTTRWRRPRSLLR